MRKTAGDQGSVQTLMNLSRILYQNLSVNDNIWLIFFVLTNLKYLQKFKNNFTLVTFDRLNLDRPCFDLSVTIKQSKSMKDRKMFSRQKR